MKALLFLVALALAAPIRADDADGRGMAPSGGASHGGGAGRGGGAGHGGGRSSVPAASGAGGGAWHGGGGSRRAVSQPNVVIKQQRVQIAQPRPLARPGAVPRGVQRPEVPARDGRGHAITQPRAVAPPSSHVQVVRNQEAIRGIRAQQRHEMTAGRYYWHTAGGLRYTHYYDNHVHWYGFYHGPHFYWSRYWGDRWWWYDPVFARWDFWWGGYWWWGAPHGAYYVYVDNAYYPYQAGEVIVKQPVVEGPSGEAAGGATYDSPDGRRMVQVVGERAEAFLYEKTGGSPRYLAYLASGVTKVRFSGGEHGKAVRILLDFSDGKFAFFDENGRAMDENAEAAAAAPPAEGAAPPTMPSSPPPSAAPPSDKDMAPPAPPPGSEPSQTP